MAPHIYDRVSWFHKSSHISQNPRFPVAHAHDDTRDGAISAVNEDIEIVDGRYEYFSGTELKPSIGSPWWFLVLAVYFDCGGDGEYGGKYYQETQHIFFYISFMK